MSPSRRDSCRRTRVTFIGLQTGWHLETVFNGGLYGAIDQRLKALDSFKDWSNYLLVTTVAALGWTSKVEVKFCTLWMREGAVLCLALSILFAILTLALIPHVAEDIKLKTNGEAPSIYHVYWHGWLVKLRLTRLCLPQHLFFLLGILLYATGTVFLPVNSRYWFIGIVGGSLCVLFVLGRLPPATEV